MYIGIDIGGTHTRVAVGENGSYKDKKDFPTKDLLTTLDEIREVIDDFGNFETSAAGVSIAGPLNFKTGAVHNPPNLPGGLAGSWSGKALADILTDKLGLKTVVSHDASAAALAESLYGAGKNKNPVLYYTISTGIGSGLVVDGKIYHGIYNPEAGHQILHKDGEICRCGQKGDLESLASGISLQKESGKNPAEVEGTEAWDKAMEWIGVGIANSILHFSPEIVVVGGGMTKHGNVCFEPVQKAVEKYLAFVPQVPIVPAGLGQDSGLIGAIELAQQSAKT